MAIFNSYVKLPEGRLEKPKIQCFGKAEITTTTTEAPSGTPEVQELQEARFVGLAGGWLITNNLMWIFYEHINMIIYDLICIYIYGYKYIYIHLYLDI